jgi:hypothetical protein
MNVRTSISRVPILPWMKNMVSAAINEPAPSATHELNPAERASQYRARMA